MTPNLNSRFSSYYFETKFKRKAKQWSITDLYDLYKKAKIRSDLRWQALSDHMEVIRSTGYETVYYNFKDGEQNIIMCVDFNFNYDGNNRKSRCTNTLKFNDSSEKENRKRKLDYLIDVNLKFKLGEEYNRLDKLRSYLHTIVFKVLCDRIIEDILKPKFKNEQYNIVNVKIYDLNLLFEIDYNGYIKFLKEITDVIEI